MGSAELLLVGGLMSAAFAVYSFVNSLMSNSQTEKDFLAWASGSERPKSKSGLVNFSRPLVAQFTLKYALKYKNESYRKRLNKMILTSGLSKELSVDEFIGLQLLWGVMFPALFGVLNFALEFGFSPGLFVLMIPLGYYLPILHANSQKKQREISVRADLPFFTDLLALSTEAGLDFIPAIQRIVEKSKDSVLATELANVLQDIKVGSSRSDALKGMAQRLDIQEITSFVTVLIDADATGGSISQVLKDQSVQIRLDRFVRAEKAGARASQSILFPMMLFIMPAVFIVLLGPVILQFFYGGSN